MSDPLPRRLPLSPRTRKLVAFGALLLGVVVVGRVMVPVAPREVTVRVGLADLRRAPSIARAVTVIFARRGEAVRSATVRFDRSGPPREWRSPMTLAQGAYTATVDVELDTSVLTRAQQVTVEPGATIDLAAPVAP